MSAKLLNISSSCNMAEIPPASVSAHDNALDMQDEFLECGSSAVFYDKFHQLAFAGGAGGSQPYKVRQDCTSLQHDTDPTGHACTY